MNEIVVCYKQYVNNEKYKLTIYPFEKASELYEEKVKILISEGIKNYSEKNQISDFFC